MENSDSKCIPTGRGHLEANPLKTHSITTANNMKRARCRVCLGKSKVMINIFKRMPHSRISIAKMISKCTGYAVSKGDSYSKIICPPCLNDAECAFQIKQTYERSYRFFCKINKMVPVQKDSLAEEIHTIPDPISESSTTPGEENQHFDCPVEPELVEVKLEIEEDLWMKEDSCRDEFECQVNNELVEEEEPEKGCTNEMVMEGCDYTANANKSIQDESSTSKLPFNSIQSHMYSPQSSIRFKFQVGSRIGSRLIHTLDDSQLYCKNKTLKNGNSTYMCRVKNCYARVYLAKDETHVFASEDNVQHNHGGQDLEIKKIIAIDKLKNKCQKNNSDLKKNFEDVMAELHRDGAEIDISYDNFKRTLQRIRKPVRMNKTIKKIE